MVCLLYMDQNAITWQAPEFEYTKKSSDWYWVLGIIAIAGSIIALLLQNILLAIFIIFGAFTVGIYADRHPRTVTFTVNKKGIKIDSTFYPYSSFESFWIDEAGTYPLLRLDPSKIAALPLAISLEATDHDALQDLLDDHLPEIEQNKSIIDKAMDVTNF